jgi:hypothetical protein
MGPGKSYAFAAALAIHAKRNKEIAGIDVLHAYIIRDTLENLKKSPIPTIAKAYGSLFETKNQSKEGYIYTDPLIHLEFIGLADGGDLSKLQGPEVGLIWPEECCPIADTRRYNAGIAEDVFNLSVVRCTRQEGVMPRLQCSANPSDEDHWFYRRIVEPPNGADLETPIITKEYFHIDPADTRYMAWLVVDRRTGDVLWDFHPETGQPMLRYATGMSDVTPLRDPDAEMIRHVNLDMIYLKAMSQQGAMYAWKNDPAMYQRMVKGEWAKVYRGKKVATSFKKQTHVATETLNPIRGYPGFRFYDSWGEPRCVMGQQLPDGQLRIYKVISDHQDIRRCCDKILAEMLHPRWKQAEIQEWRDIGDATMTRHDQSNRMESASKVVEEFFDTTFEPGSARWETGLKAAMLAAFGGSTSDGEPYVLITPEEKGLIAGLEGRWHYPMDGSGNAKPGSQPVKTSESHACDALVNGFSVLKPWQPAERRTIDLARVRAQRQRRARSYSTPRISYG